MALPGDDSGLGDLRSGRFLDPVTARWSAGSAADYHSAAHAHRLHWLARAGRLEPAPDVPREAPLVHQAVGRGTVAVCSCTPVGRLCIPADRLRDQLLMARLELAVTVETLRLAQPFRISGYVFTSSDIVVVTLADGDFQGRGEGGGVYYLGDDVPHMLQSIGVARKAIEAGPTREELRSIMPAGGARNAVDCALWELEAARAGVPVWQLAGQSAPQPLRTTFTLGADSPDAMASGARRYAAARSIKV